ncbi:MAG: VWA domain-containing protein [Myxococcales bacterium]|nr:VWA domain-containing protein [Myxococcales bacterium]
MSLQRLLVRLSLCLVLAGCLSESKESAGTEGSGASPGGSDSNALNNVGSMAMPSPMTTSSRASAPMAGAGGAADGPVSAPTETVGANPADPSGPGTPAGAPAPTPSMTAPAGGEAGFSGDTDTGADGGEMAAGARAPAAEEPASDEAEPSADPLPPSDPVEPMVPVERQAGLQGGTLTAGAWDDNLNFNRFEEYRREHAGLHGALASTDEEHTEAWNQWKGERDGNETLDIALVIDTTGSMGDEIRYLQAEFDALTKAIVDAHPDADQRWALITYKDQGDVYVVRSVDFTGDVAEYGGSLAEISAAGGGDYPEAPDAALEALSGLAFRTEDSTARVAFWVGDAPHHARNADALLSAVRAAAGADVHIYPVASSGVDELTELTMRTAAQLTGGRYLFLTDDSGVGGSHKEPSIPCYFVTRLDQAILRMVDIELSGTYRMPEEDHIIRTGGDPEDGSCQLESGDEVLVF